MISRLHYNVRVKYRKELNCRFYYGTLKRRDLKILITVFIYILFLFLSFVKTELPWKISSVKNTQLQFKKNVIRLLISTNYKWRVCEYQMNSIENFRKAVKKKRKKTSAAHRRVTWNVNRVWGIVGHGHEGSSVPKQEALYINICLCL